MKADRLAILGTQKDIHCAIGYPCSNQFVVRSQIKCNYTSSSGPAVSHNVCFFNQTVFCCHKNVGPGFKWFYSKYSGELFVLFKVKKIDNCLTTTDTARLRNFIYFTPVHFAKICEKQEGMMCWSNKNMFREIFFFCCHGVFPFAATVLALINCNRGSFYVTAVWNADHHVFLNYHILYSNFFGGGGYFCAALIPEIILYLCQLVFYNTFNKLFTW